MPTTPFQGIAPAASKTAQQRQFLIALKTVLDRAYQDGVDQFYNWKIEGDTITGVFRDGAQGYKFSLSENGLIYHPIGKNRSDSDIEGATLANSAMRFDAGAKRKKCKGTTTYACGGACLPNKKVCRINSKHIVTAQELKTLTALGNGLSKPPFAEAEAFKVFEKPLVDLSGKTEPGQKIEKKPLEKMTIRELRAEAQARGVPGYSHVDKDTLKAMVVAWDKEPEEQRRIIKVIEKRTKERKSDPFNDFKRFFGLKKVLGAGSAITAAMILQVGTHAYSQVKNRYAGGFSTSAEAAKAGAAGVKVAKVPDSKEYVTFAVDRLGDHNTGTLEKELTASDPAFFKKHHIVTVGSDAFEEGGKVKPNPLVPPQIKDEFESYQAISKRLHSQIIRGRDPQAIALAAQVLAYHKKYPDKQINLVGDHDGGMVVNEAAEILIRAKKDLAQNLRIVNIATPHFGLTETVTSQKGDFEGVTTTVSASNDPNNFFPKQNNLQFGSVKDSSVKAYLADKDAKEALLGGLGRNDATNSPYSDLSGTSSRNAPWRKSYWEELTPEEKLKRVTVYLTKQAREAEGRNPRPSASTTPAKQREKIAAKAAPKVLKQLEINQKAQETRDKNKAKEEEEARKRSERSRKGHETRRQNANKPASPTPTTPPAVSTNFVPAPGEPVQDPILPKAEPQPTEAKKRKKHVNPPRLGDDKRPPADDLPNADKNKNKKDAAESSAYLEAFSLTARRFKGA